MTIPSIWIFGISILSILCIVFFCLRGYKYGLLLRALELLSTFLCIPIAWVLSDTLSQKFPMLIESYAMESGTVLDDIVNTMMNRVCIFVLLFLGLRIILLLFRPFFRRVNHVPLVGKVNKVLGLFFGFVQGFVIIALFTFLLSTPLFKNGLEVQSKSGLWMVKDVTQQLLHNAENWQLLESMQKASNPDIVLNASEQEEMLNWMEEQGFSETEQKEIMKFLEDRK